MTDGTVNSAKNTGNIAKQTVNFTGLSHPFVQAYRYDPLQRLTEAKETKNGSQTWKQTFGYDRYGNRTAFTQVVGNQNLTINSLTLPAVDINTNRFQTIPSQGYAYDKNGNITFDPAAEGRQFVFNGDNKQIEVKDANGNPIGKYYYDGEGRRVKKITDLETTIFIYSAGKLAAEYSTQTPPANPTINYTATDQLGSPRVLTDKYGAVISRRDFMPFGEEIYADGSHRTTVGKYSLSGEDAVRKRFTGYEKDKETGLDFAEARYYNNQHARFTAVDPLLTSGKSANPQTFNRYVYVMNRPLSHTDSTGLQAATNITPCTNGPGCGLYTQNEEQAANNTVSIHSGASVEITFMDTVMRESTDRLWNTTLSYFRGGGKGAANFGIGCVNTPVTMPMIAFIPGTSLHDLFGVPKFVERFEYNTNEEALFGYTAEIATGFAAGGISGQLARSATLSTTTSRSLPILNPHFTPDATRVLQNITNTANAELAANPALAQTVLSEPQYLAGQRAPWLANIQYGNAVEKIAAQRIGESSLHQQLFQHMGGPGRPDFIGKGLANGVNFDITTVKQINSHLTRPYGDGLQLCTYQRPGTFSVF